MYESSIQEKYNVKYAQPGKDHNFEQIPDILDHLTYIQKEEQKEENGNVTVKFYRKRLSVYAKELYRIIKKAVGKSVCWKNTEDLAYDVNCSEGSITNAKKELSQSFEQLDGLSLIDIIESRVPRYDAAGIKNGTKPKHTISIVNIWRWNNTYMSVSSKIDRPQLGEISANNAEVAIEKMYQRFKEIPVDNPGADSPHESGGGADSPHESPSWGADSPGERIHTLTSYTYVKEAYPTASETSAAQSCLLSNENVKTYTKSLSSVLDWLYRFGFNPKMREKIGVFPLEEIVLNIKYCALMASKKKISNIRGYFWDSLQNKHFLKQFASRR